MKYNLLNKFYYKGTDIYLKEYDKRINSIGCITFNFKIDSNPIFMIPTIEILNLTAKIYKKNSELNKKMLSLPGIALNSYQTSCLIDEIMLTNDIEGIYSTRREIKEVISTLPKNNNKRFTGLVKKYLLLLKSHPDIPLNTCEEVRSLYDEIVLDEIKSEQKENIPDGEIFRKEIAQVISGTQKVKHIGIFPESKIINSMNQALSILNNEGITPLIRISIFHYLFGYIHPFYDGNGRTSRFISSYTLAQELSSFVAYRLSFAIKEKKEEYYKAFDFCNDKKNKGDITPFVIMFLEMIDRAIDNLSTKINEGYEKLNFYHDLIKKSSLEEKEKKVLFYLIQNSLFSNDPLCRKELANMLKCSYPTAKTILNLLIKNGAPIFEKTEDHNKKVYLLDLDTVSDYLKQTVNII
ncbi:Fic family protein [Anaerovorax odorimutans]|uniref:Fic family protein n=1 Tax=Anaerovorax odorimutans TaxID=109327 RepID=UPI000417CCD4|nr:Fic family protein [Anaerovorax odorimutans]